MNLPANVSMAAQEVAITDSGPYGLDYLDVHDASAHPHGGLVVALGGKGANEFADLQRWLPGMEVRQPDWNEPGVDGAGIDLDGVDRVYLVAGLGGRHGGAAALKLAQAARDRGIPAHALVSLPFDFEQAERHVGADRVRTQLEHLAASCLAMRNQDLVELFGGDAPIAAAFAMQTRWLAHAMTTLDGLAAAKRFQPAPIANGRGVRLRMGYARASGQDRTDRAMEATLEHPLLGNPLGEQAWLALCSGVNPSEDEMRLAEGMTLAALVGCRDLVTHTWCDPRMGEDIYATLLIGN